MTVIPYAHPHKLRVVGRPTASDEKSEALREIVRAITAADHAGVQKATADALGLTRSALNDFVNISPGKKPGASAPGAERLSMPTPTPSVAALYVQTRGVYYGVDGVDAWGLPDRDAREYAGPWPVVAHPPRERWGRYARGGPNPLARRRELGDDNGCFAAALASVRTWGGVLEHPADSHAWAAHGLIAPPRAGGWVAAGDWQGWTCCVEQGHYGHRARKATWLYAVRCTLPSLIWGPSGKHHPLARLDEGFHSAEERRRSQKRGTIQRLAKRAAAATPIPFRDVLIEMARSVAPAAREVA